MPIIHFLNQNYNYLYDFIKFLVDIKENFGRAVRLTLLDPNLTCLQTPEQCLVLKRFYEPPVLIKNIFSQKEWSHEEIHHAFYLWNDNPLFKTYFIVRMNLESISKDILDFFHNPEEYEQSYKYHLINENSNSEIQNLIFNNLVVLDYLRLNQSIFSKFQDLLREKMIRSTSSLFIDPIYENVLNALNGQQVILHPTDIESLKRDPIFKAYFETSAIRTFFEERMTKNQNENQMRI